MERAVLLGMATWVGGVGAWAVGAGYALAQGHASARGRDNFRDSPTARLAPQMQMSEDDSARPVEPPVEVEVIDESSLTKPPLPLDAKGDTSPPANMRLASIPEERLGTAAAGSELDEDDEFNGEDYEEGLAAYSPSLELRRPDDPANSALLTDSQRRRLAPIKSLRRKRRSRKLRIAGADEDGFVPLVKGARATTDDSIVAASQASGESLDVQRERGEDYWVDPALLQAEFDEKERVKSRRARFKRKEKAFAEAKLREEIVAPYKNNVIGTIVLGIGVAAVVFAAFPNLLELNEPSSIASFPDSL
jgi:hypothetical protein